MTVLDRPSAEELVNEIRLVVLGELHFQNCIGDLDGRLAGRIGYTPLSERCMTLITHCNVSVYRDSTGIAIIGLECQSEVLGTNTRPQVFVKNELPNLVEQSGCLAKVVAFQGGSSREKEVFNKGLVPFGTVSCEKLDHIALSK